MSVLTSDPQRLGCPRLILRRVPAPALCNRSPLCSPSDIFPHFLSGSASSPSSLAASPPSSASISSLPTPAKLCPSSLPGSYRKSSPDLPSPDPTLSSLPVVPLSPARFSPCLSPESAAGRWINVPVDDTNKIILHWLSEAGPSVTPEGPTKVCPAGWPPRRRPCVLTAGPRPKWVRTLRALLKERNGQRGVRRGKRAAGRQGNPLTNAPCRVLFCTKSELI